jgi:hypothetical protein
MLAFGSIRMANQSLVIALLSLKRLNIDNIKFFPTEIYIKPEGGLYDNFTG